MEGILLVLFVLLLQHSHAQFSSCPATLRPDHLNIASVWAWRNLSLTNYRISHEDLSSNRFERIEEGTVLIPSEADKCPMGVCMVRLELKTRSDGSSYYEENVGLSNSIQESYSPFILCAREHGDCGATHPILVHSRVENGKKQYAYSVNESSTIPSFSRQTRPLCFGWTPSSSHSSSSPSSCPQLKDVHNGKIAYSSESTRGVHSIGTSATLSCMGGYSSAGDSFTLCTSNGWHPSVPLGPCVLHPVAASVTSPSNSSSSSVGCPMMNDIPNGKLVYSSNPITGRFSFNSTVILLCDLGYAPAGEITSECHSGQWSNSPLSLCYASTSFKCNPPLPVLNGKITYNFSSIPYSIGSSVRVTCNNGFHLTGSDVITCRDNGWNPPSLATCERNTRRKRQSSVQCPILQSVMGGKISYTLPLTPTAQGSTAVLVCQEGTVPHGSLSTVCLNGQWTNVLGSCGSSFAPAATAGTNCLKMPNIINGRITYSLGEMDGSFPPSTTASPSCNTGYNLYGSLVATCLPSGQWTSMSLGNCGPGMPNECTEFESPNAIINYNLPTGRAGFRRESTIATLACSTGVADGNVVSTCVGGKWSPPFGQCAQSSLKCQALSTPVGGSLQYSNGMVQGPFPSGTIVKLTCATAALRGSSIVECSNGQWKGEGGSTIGSCGEHGGTGNAIVSGGRFGDYEDTQGLRPSSVVATGSNVPMEGDGDLIGGGSKRCIAPIIPIGGRLSFSSISSLDSYSPGTTVQLMCPNSMVAGSSSSQCTTGGVWTPNLGVCDGRNEGGVVDTNQLRSWNSQSTPSIVSPPLQQSGIGSACTMAPMGGASSGSFPSGTSLTLQCPLGSAVMGSVVATCTNGQWSQMGSCAQSDTTCAPFGSLDRTTIEDGELRYSNGMSGRVSLGTVVRVNCSLGYRVEGATASVCTGNGWQPMHIGKCTMDIGEFRGVNSCAGAPLLLNGQVTYSTSYPYPIGSQARAYCNAGYILNGNSVVTCISGLWTPNSFGACVSGPSSFSSPTVLSPSPTVMTPSPTLLPAPQQVFTEQTTTTPFPQQSSTISNCLIPPLTPLFGTLKYSTGAVLGPWSPGTIVALICNNGKHVSGAGAASCHGGSFNPPQLGTCIDSSSASRSPCSPPSTPINGHFNFSSSLLPSGTYPDGAMVALFCHSSTIPHISTCSNGLWSPLVLLSCSDSSIVRRVSRKESPLSCPSLRAPPNGEITFSLSSISDSDLLYPLHTRASLLCYAGSRLIGNRLSLCGEEGVFSPPLGHCSLE